MFPDRKGHMSFLLLQYAGVQLWGFGGKSFLFCYLDASAQRREIANQQLGICNHVFLATYLCICFMLSAYDVSITIIKVAACGTCQAWKSRNWAEASRPRKHWPPPEGPTLCILFYIVPYIVGQEWIWERAIVSDVWKLMVCSCLLGLQVGEAPDVPTWSTLLGGPSTVCTTAHTRSWRCLPLWTTELCRERLSLPAECNVKIIYHTFGRIVLLVAGRTHSNMHR